MDGGSAKRAALRVRRVLDSEAARPRRHARSERMSPATTRTSVPGPASEIASLRISGGVMTLNRRDLLVSGPAALGGVALSGPALASQAAPAGIDGSKSAALFLKDDNGLAPASFDRPPL